MNFYNVIENRTSNKSFNSTKIPEEKLNRILNAALMAPSWKNKTCYKFIIVENENIKDKIASAIENNSDKTPDAVRQAPILAIIVADPNESGNVDDKSYFLVDCGIAMEHLILAATNEEYGTCWIGSFDENNVKEVLNIPQNFKVVAMTPIGQTDEPIEHYQPKDVSQHIFYDKWNNRSNK